MGAAIDVIAHRELARPQDGSDIEAGNFDAALQEVQRLRREITISSDLAAHRAVAKQHASLRSGLALITTPESPPIYGGINATRARRRKRKTKLRRAVKKAHALSRIARYTSAGSALFSPLSFLIYFITAYN